VSVQAVASAQAQVQPVRLQPRRPWQEDAGLYSELFGDPAVAATLWPGALGGARSEQQALAILAADIQHWREESFGPWIFFQASTGEFVGRCGLLRATILGRESVELLYALRAECWGEGYATEMAITALAHARRLGLEEVVGFTTMSNGASRQVLEKVGVHYERSFERAGLPHWLGRWHPSPERLPPQSPPIV